MSSTLVSTFILWILVAMVTAIQQAVPLSYSHWCPSIEMKRISCVSRTGALQGQRNGNGNDASILRRVYRWKKQFVLRCCPGFMGPNCQQACFSCRGYAALKEKLTQIERLVQETYNNGDRQTPDPERPLRPTVSFHTTSVYDKTQYGTVGYRQRSSRQGTRSSHAYFREAPVGTIKRPVVVETPPELVVALSGFPTEGNMAEEEYNGTRSSAIQNDQMSNDSTLGSPDAPVLTTSVPAKPPGQQEDSKYRKWSQEQTMEPSQVKDSFTGSPTAEVESVWKHWDEEFQIRLSTLERQVLELETKLSTLSSALASVTSLNDEIGEINERVATLETYSKIPDPISQSKSDGKAKDRLEDRASPEAKVGHKGSRRRRNNLKKYNGKLKEKDASGKFGDHSSDIEPYHEGDRNSPQRTNKDKLSKSKINSKPSNVKDHFSTSQNSGKPPANLAFNRNKSRLKFKNSKSNMQTNDSLSYNSIGGLDDVRPKRNISSKSAPPCENLCQDQNVPSRPPPPPLPDKEIVEKVFTDNPHLLDALGHGHKTFHKHLKAVLNRNSTNIFDAEEEPQTKLPPPSSALGQQNNTPEKDSGTSQIEGFTGRIVFGHQSQISDERSDLPSQLTSGGLEGEKTDFTLQRGNMADSDHGESGNAHENKIGHYKGPRSNAFPLSVSTSFFLNVLCIPMIVIFTR